MPSFDDEKAVGTVFVESRETGNYSKNYMVVDFTSHKIRLYPTEAEFLQDPRTHLEEIGCQYITKVGSMSTRPRILNCFEMVTTTGTYNFAANNPDERDEWIDTLKKSSMKHSSMKIASQNKSVVSYQTTIVAGVVVRTPIQGTAQDTADTDSAEKSTSGGAVLPTHSAKLQRHIVKVCFAVKLGAVRKSWKKRLFILTDTTFGYYKTLEELEPIKSFAVADVSRVAPNKDKEKNTFEVVTPSRTFYIAADSEADLDDWIKAFNSVVRPTVQQLTSETPPNPSDMDEMTWI
eukprot:Em0013g721a